jgi:hypothetical protein
MCAAPDFVVRSVRNEILTEASAHCRTTVAARHSCLHHPRFAAYAITLLAGAEKWRL